MPAIDTSPNGWPNTSRRVPQHVDQHRTLHVLVERLGDAQLLRPLDVVADVRRVDARARYFQLVVDLDRLELHDPPAGEPGEHEVLSHLRLRTGGRARRRFRPRDREIAPTNRGGEAASAAGTIPLPRRQVEDRLLVAKLQPHPLDHVGERRAEEIDHVRTMQNSAIHGCRSVGRRIARAFCTYIGHPSLCECTVPIIACASVLWLRSVCARYIRELKGIDDGVLRNRTYLHHIAARRFRA